MKLVKAYRKPRDIAGSLCDDLLIIAGPCAIEDEGQMFKVARFLEEKHVRFLRAAAFKPRTSPYSFQGLGEIGLDIIKRLKERFSLKIVSEIIHIAKLDFYLEYVDILQVGARNMQNFELLKELGKINKPVIIKRGFGNTIEEWLNAAEYVLSAGNENIILCERGIRTFEPLTRNTLDVGAIALAKSMTSIPVIADPSHAAGRRDLVEPLALAAVAAGASGLMIEVHPSPESSVSDRDQALSFQEFSGLLERVNVLYRSLREI